MKFLKNCYYLTFYVNIAHRKSKLNSSIFQSFLYIYIYKGSISTRSIKNLFSFCLIISKINNTLEVLELLF